ncbi:MAG: DUF1573 domain-containing protein [Bacteroidetes bacterium]|nr:DUF1573 domain-containing protein [Bacteroidota bacterium]
MKKWIFILPALFLFSGVKAQNVAQDTVATDISKMVSFSELDHDFGKIPYGKPVEYSVTMKNISSKPIGIKDVVKSCGCTTPEWSAGPYAAGDTFNVKLGFSGYADGSFSKLVTIYFDNGLTQVIKFHGETFKAPDNAAPANTAISKMKNGL